MVDKESPRETRNKKKDIRKDRREEKGQAYDRKRNRIKGGNKRRIKRMRREAWSGGGPRQRKYVMTNSNHSLTDLIYLEGEQHSRGKKKKENKGEEEHRGSVGHVEQTPGGSVGTSLRAAKENARWLASGRSL